jgi:hypothetical protein
MAEVIISSQMLSLLLGLLETPVTSSLFDGLAQFLGRVREKRGWQEAAELQSSSAEPQRTVYFGPSA